MANSMWFYINSFYAKIKEKKPNLEFKIALVQLLVGANKLENVKNAIKSIEIAAKNGSSIVALPVIIMICLKKLK